MARTPVKKTASKTSPLAPFTAFAQNISDAFTKRIDRTDKAVATVDQRVDGVVAEVATLAQGVEELQKRPTVEDALGEMTRVIVQNLK